MPSVYERYGEYRQELSDEEKGMLEYARKQEEKLLADASLQRWEHGWINSEGKRELFPVRDTEVKIAISRAENHFLPWDNTRTYFPEDPGIVEKFPGIDPKGKFSQVDMSFADRHAKLQAAMPSRPREVQDYVNRQLRALGGSGGDIAKCFQRMRNDSMKVRTQHLAAKMAPTPESSRYLEEEAQSLINNSVNIKRMNGFFNVLEYAADRAAVVRALADKLKPGGTLSVIKHNRPGRVMQMAVLLDDFDRANALLDGGDDAQAVAYGAIRYNEDGDISRWAPELKLTKTLGQRTFWDLQQNQEKQTDPQWQAQMLALERRVSSLPEYLSIAFFHHLFFEKSKN